MKISPEEIKAWQEAHEAKENEAQRKVDRLNNAIRAAAEYLRANAPGKALEVLESVL